MFVRKKVFAIWCQETMLKKKEKKSISIHMSQVSPAWLLLLFFPLRVKFLFWTFIAKADEMLLTHTWTWMISTGVTVERAAEPLSCCQDGCGDLLEHRS